MPLHLREKTPSPAFRFSLYYGLLFLIFGVYWPYFPTWLAGHGLTVEQVGFILSLAYWARMVAAPLIAFMSTKSVPPKRLLLGLVSVSAIAFALFAGAKGLFMIAVVAVLSAGAIHTALPFGEALAVQASRAGLFDYGRVRLWGSVTFIFANVVGAALLGRWGTDTILIWIVGFGVLLIAVTAALPGESGHQSKDGTGPRASLGEAARVLLRPRTISFVMAASLIQSTHAVYYAFAVIDWRGQGLPDLAVGSIWAWAVVAEVVLFYFAGRTLSRLAPEHFLFAGGVCALVRWTIMAFEPGVALLVVIQTLHAFTFGATHLAVMRFFAERIPPHLGPTAQSLYSALAIGGVIGLTTLVGTALYRFDPSLGYAAMAVIGTAGLVLALATSRRGVAL